MAGECLAAGQQLIQRRLVAVMALALPQHRLIGDQPQPLQCRKLCRAGAGHFTRRVEVFDADQPLTTGLARQQPARSEEHTSELQSLMRISYAVFCLKKKTTNISYQPQSTT